MPTVTRIKRGLDLPISGQPEQKIREAASVDRVVLIPQSNKQSSADFYAKNPPPLGHYTAASMKRIGQRFFEAYQKSYANSGLGHKEGDE